MTATNAEALTRRVEQKGSFELPMTAETAFPLFSPEGERLWVPQWNPTPIFPVDDVVRWQTNAAWSIVRDGELLTWWTIEVDHKNRNASYVHFSTGRAVRVNVHVEPTGPSACRVQVEYIITATSPEGEHHVSQACNMEARMTQWKNLIEAALPNGKVPPIRH